MLCHDAADCELSRGACDVAAFALQLLLGPGGSELRKWWLCVDREKETWRHSAALHEQFCSRWHQTDLMSQSYHMARGWLSTLLPHFTHNPGFTVLHLDLWKPYRSSQITEAALWTAGLHSVLHTGDEHVWVNQHVWRLSTYQHTTHENSSWCRTTRLWWSPGEICFSTMQPGSAQRRNKIQDSLSFNH